MSTRRHRAVLGLALALTAAACADREPPEVAGDRQDATTTSSDSTTTTSPPTSTEAPTSTEPPATEPAPTTTVDLSVPETVRFDGEGDEVITIDPDDPLTREAYILAAIHGGDAAFEVRVLDAVGELIDVLVDQPGTYVGFRPYNFFLGQVPGFIEVRADATWQIELIPVQDVPQRDSTSGTVVEGSGDIVFWFNVVDEPAIVDFSCSDCAGPIRIRALGTGSDDLVDETADGTPFDTSIVVPLATLMVEVQTYVGGDPPTPGSWTMTVR